MFNERNDTKPTLSQVFPAMEALHVESASDGDVVITQGANTIRFSARLAVDVRHAIGEAEMGNV